MTTNSLTSIVSTHVPAAAITMALQLACKLGRRTNQAKLLVIARHHGGDALMAEAILYRLNMFAMLLTIDPGLVAETAKLSPDDLGVILAEFPISSDDGKLDFDGDALAAAIRLASEPVGTA
jgi:hypothetical protein